jgi:hypothetical protein
MNRRELPALLDTLRKTPIALARLLDGLTPAQLAWKPAPGEFSMLENVCHLRDIEQDGWLVRVRRVRFESRPVLEDIDGDRLAVERAYSRQSLAVAHAGFVHARKLTVQLLDGVSQEDLDRGGILEKAGPVTLGSLAGMMRDHDAGHLAGMKALRERLASGAA